MPDTTVNSVVAISCINAVTAPARTDAVVACPRIDAVMASARTDAVVTCSRIDAVLALTRTDAVIAHPGDEGIVRRHRRVIEHIVAAARAQQQAL